MSTLKIGDTAPEFKSYDQNHKKVVLSEVLQNKSVVLFFYPKDNTPICTKEACRFRDYYEVFQDLGSEVIGVSSDSIESHRGFAEKYKLPFTLLSDKDDILRRTYKISKTFGLFPGRVTYIIGQDQVIKGMYNSQFKGEKHVDEAVKVLKEN